MTQTAVDGPSGAPIRRLQISESQSWRICARKVWGHIE
jgi:hypothetical protein